ncbi:MAG: LLM class flavin-dependent oxidoreductase [Deltaproteobacteria bacterium]|jgi:FMNH2-dependent dimethyl sulfone monooxygenase
MGLELGFFIPPVPPEQFITMALKAEEAGYDFVTCDDHMIYPFGAPFSEEGQDYGINEAWTAMTYVAGATSKISVSHMVLVITFRGPGLLAKMGATLDLFSGGRMDLTVGAGWFEREFRAFDFPWEEHKERLEREREAVRIIRSLWTEPRVSFEGTYYRLQDAEVTPKPLQKPTPPIWIGGDSKRSMELAAELGDGWLVHGHQPHEIDAMFQSIRPLLGVKTEGFGLGAAAFVIMGSDPDDATRKMRQMISPAVWERFQMAGIRHELNNRVSGNPQQCFERIKQYEKVGVTRFILIFLDPEDAEWFGREVLPELRRP